ncbi:unnamed protein product [Clonostachys chloroleuca]|uniref:Carboxylic ester hydrolase n=1 Tax=Clonostachys chloroleuca TaxID=1926264 RepID=A0AA35Q1I1_9HYPO|nr:unnamed protein product [Clonostachys chloroleuca]
MAMSSLTDHCVDATFGNPVLFGADILSLQADLVTGYSNYIPEGYIFSQPSVFVRNATFCNVTVSYTHPGYNDKVTVESWLPVEGYNGRLQAVGGGGWSPGRGTISYWGMAGAIYYGYATVTTDSGVTELGAPDSWALASPGNLNWAGLSNFGYVSLNDEAVIAKSLVESFYGEAPSYAYWNGCSQGGRQGMALAQQYPNAYDGILSAAPAINWSPFVMSTIWPAFYMNHTGQYPQACELDYITSLAIEACDELDGVKDGLIAEPEQCLRHFNATEHVGKKFVCSTNSAEVQLTAGAADVATAIWTGPTSLNGEFMWYGFDIGSSLSTIAPTSCTDTGDCFASGQLSIATWWRNFVDMDPESNRTSISWEEFDILFKHLKRAFDSTFETSERDLSSFRDAGGKLINFHGLADQSIPVWNTLSYYREVASYLGGVDDFYQYYRVPGLAHCAGGAGGQPIALFDQLRLWVENGTAPSHSPVTIKLPDNTTRVEIICPYPSKAVFGRPCTNLTSTSCWSCEL